MPHMPTGKPNGRPRKKTTSVPKKQKKSTAPAFDLSTYEGLLAASDIVLQQQIENANDQVAWYKSRRDALIESGGKVDAGELANIETNFRQALKYQSDLWGQLRKQCELYEEKKAGRESDPLYTPVHIHLSLPAPSIIAPQAFAPPDDTVPGATADGD